MSEARVAVRAARPGEGGKIAGLWRELWEAHEGWGGYASSREDRVFQRLAVRLDEDARVRADYPVLGRHLHLIATVKGEVAGQVEGWFDRHGFDSSTPYTCEVRSLVVSSRMRKLGVGAALLDHLAKLAVDLARGSKALLVAEVLEPNPAQAFYVKMGFSPVSYNAFVPVDFAVQIDSRFSARHARPSDALAIALLEGPLAERRRAAGDARFDSPHAVDATLVGAIASHLDRPQRDPQDPIEIVVVDAKGGVRGAASFGSSSLDPPFVPAKRAVLARFALDPAIDPIFLTPPLVAEACALAREVGARGIELVDLPAPGSPLFDAVLGPRGLGAQAWSRIVLRAAE
ncbi:MAG: GNAT family N-acetyltransferase [Polyangiaceae bacterium]